MPITVIIRRRVAAAAVAVLIAGSLFVTTAAAQDVRPTLVPDEPTCPQCTVRLTRLMTAGGAAGSPKITSIPGAVVVDGARRYWVFAAGTPLVFDSSGREVGPVSMNRARAAGFRGPGDAVLAGDSVVVLDQISRVAAVFAANLIETRTVTYDLPLVRSKIVRWPDFVIGVGLLPTPSALGWPLHRISATGSEAAVVSSFGPGKGELRAGTPEINGQVIAPGVENGFWSYQPTKYRLVRWDSTLRATQVIERRPAWFPDSGGPPLGGPRTPPSPAIRAVHVDSAGLLWVFISVPSETWPSAWPAPRPGLSEVSSSRVAYEKLYRTAIEVIDPRSGRVVTRTFTETWISSALSGNRAVTYTTESGAPRLSVVSLTIDRGDAR